MLRRFGSHVRNQWMGALALFLVLAGGTAYAVVGTVYSSDIVNGEVKLVDTDTALRLKCPPLTVYHEGACIEQQLRDSVDWSTARVTCDDARRRLPSLEELLGFKHEPNVTLAPDAEWVINLGNSTGLALVVAEDWIAQEESDALHTFRCVAPAKR